MVDTSNDGKLMDFSENDEHPNIEFVDCGSIEDSQVDQKPGDFIYGANEFGLWYNTHTTYISDSRMKWAVADIFVPSSNNMIHVNNETQPACNDNNCTEILSSNWPAHFMDPSFVHDRLKLFSCDKCSNYFSLKSQLKLHSKIIHTEKTDPFYCGICSKSFSSKCSLTQHIRKIHEINKYSLDKKNFRCDICRTLFSSKYELQYHIISSGEGEKPFRCDICYKFFSHNIHLQRHRESHIRELIDILAVCN